jgi:hypothetical protein
VTRLDEALARRGWTYPPDLDEPIDPEVLPLCEALQAAGFDTIFSCGGHESGPYVAWLSSGADVQLVLYLNRRAETEKRFTLWPAHIYQACRIPGIKSYWQLKLVVHDGDSKDACAEVAGWVKDWWTALVSHGNCTCPACCPSKPRWPAP